jgi:hypothetical protein
LAAPTNTVTSVTPNVGIREDLSDVIYRVAPEKTPFVSNIRKAKATQVYHEWQTEALAAASSTNAALEGGDVGTLDAANLTTRLGNTCQILTKTGGVARTQDVVKLAGRDNETARQKIMKGIEIRRDLEIRAIGNFAAVAEAGATTRKLGGALAWLTSNDSRGSGGSDGGFTASPGPAAATNGTQRTFTETLIKSALATTFNNGGSPSQAYMGATHKQQFSSFTGIADIRKDAGDGMATIVAAADVYVSDFGDLALIPHPYGLTRDCLIIDPEFWAIATLDGIKTAPLGKTGDSTKWLMTWEATLESRNEKSSTVVADLV